MLCPGREEEFVGPPDEDWVKCGTCEEWWHEKCSSYQGSGQFTYTTSTLSTRGKKREKWESLQLRDGKDPRSVARGRTEIWKAARNNGRTSQIAVRRVFAGTSTKRTMEERG
ncbi:hypothetical protein PR048_016387 [Dryococelus australis]|uniref:Zinc finger PHD-type domain-containing protein n=1 Tax=Dryococelus australis TaxID=614101 RepID=A0ABQ9HK16_9NEOP|nr:hypothetical protein PR048_016387 [Dryococelus australis]